MKRLLSTCLLLALTAPLCGQAETNDKASLLIQRLASPGGEPVDVQLGKLPSGIPNVPLPNAVLIGGTHTTVPPHSAMAMNAFQLFYQGSRAALASYRSALEARGWAPRSFPDMNHGGFETNVVPPIGMYCKPGGPLVTVRALGDNEDDLRVDIASGFNTSAMCSAMESTEQIMQSMKTPIPNLTAPAGTSMTVSSAGIPNGKSGAHIVGGTSPTALLDAFAAQMTGAGWKADTRVASDAIGSQSFEIVDSTKATWQCVFTIYAIEGKPKEFIAFIDATNLTTLGNQSNFNSYIYH